jgi:hypothetical protein
MTPEELVEFKENCLVREAVNRRNEAREELLAAEEDLIHVLEPFFGRLFKVDGVPMRVCRARGSNRLYIRSLVGQAEAARLREEYFFEEDEELEEET